MHCQRIIKVAVMTCLALAAIVTGRPANAQTATLFAPLSQTAAADATPQQATFLRILRADPTTATLQLVRADLDALQGEKTVIPLPDVGQQIAQHHSTVTRDASDFTWIGDMPNGGQAILVVQNGEITGSIRSGTDLYRVAPLGDGVHAVVKVDQSKFPPEHPPGPLPIAPHSHSDQPQSPATSTVNAAVQYDVLVAYTSSAAAAVSNINATIQLAVDETNQAYVNSQANVSVRLAGTILVSGYDEGSGSSAFNTNLSDLQAGTLPSMAAVHAKRDAVGADEVVLIINNSASCGLGYVNSTVDYAFVVVHYSCATGYYSFAHEIGHNFGALHDPYVSPPNTSDPFAYGHGYVNGTTVSGWRTVMAYADACNNCPRLQYFSNPNVLYLGVPMGNTTVSHNARVLTERAPAIAAFKSAAAPSQLVAATLPSSRSVQVGNPATAFATMINTGSAATGCGFSPTTSVPATFLFQTTNPSTNAPTGTPNTRVPIAASGSQTYYFAFTPTGAMTSTDVALNFNCTGVTSAPSIVGVNTVLLTFSSTPVPDVIALAATASNDGILNIPGTNGAGAFAVATANIGTSSSITASADFGAVTLPASLTICQTNSSGQCAAAPSSTVTTTINTNATPTFSIFAAGAGTVPFDPANNRVFVRFKDPGGITRGSTSVAVRTQ
jgi:hypothetical protein